MSLRRVVQALTFALFLVLLWFTDRPLPKAVTIDAFARLDPGLMLGAALAVGSVALIGLPVLLLLAGTAIFGRFFCSHICPLGTTLDLARPLFRDRKKIPFTPPETWRKGKYLFLVFLAAAAVYGVNLSHFGTPVSLAVRLYALVLGPALAFLLAPIPLHADFLQPVNYAGLLFLAPFLGLILVSTRWAPRFWCRYLCPSGAILALAGFRPLVVRRVSDACTDCGKCQRRCPTGAINTNDPARTDFRECVACRTCEDVCPESAVTFGPARERAAVKGLTAGTGRREALGALALGLAAAFTAKSGISGVRGESGGKVMPDILVRPPGSRPEDDFLGLCTRCSLCIKACPTSMLQPGILEAGLAGLFAPLARPRAGPCEPSCNACGHACPTGAITALPPAEKTWAKMGTAVVYRRKCLAWEFDKACLVCDEACPYDAVRLIKVDGVSVGVPVVDEHKCSGCGYCENKCPVVGLAAIRVSPMAALRLPPDESYPERAKEAGLSIIRASEREAPETPEDFEGPPPGFEK